MTRAYMGGTQGHLVRIGKIVVGIR